MWLVNHSERPILDVTVIACEMRSDATAVAVLPDDSESLQIVKPEKESRTAGVKFFSADGIRLPHERNVSEGSGVNSWPGHEELDLVGWLGFTDVDGNRWARSSEGELRLITKPSDIRRLIR